MPIGSLSAKKAPPPAEFPSDQPKYLPAKSVFHQIKPKKPYSNFSTKILIVGIVGVLAIALILRLTRLLTSFTGLAILILAGIGLVSLFCWVVIE